MMKKNLLILGCMLIACSSVKAQVQVNFKTEYIGESSYRIMKSESSEQVGNSKGAAMVYQADVSIPLSVKFNDRNNPTSWTLNVGGAYANLNNKNFNAPLVINEITNLNLSLTHLRPLNKKWSMMATVGVGLYMPSTNFSQIGFKNVLGSVGVVFIRHLKPNLDIGGGLMLNNSFGYPMLYPAFYLSWQTGGKTDLEVSLMNALEISAGYDVNEKLRLNFIVEMNGQMALLKQGGKNMMFSHMYMVTGLRPEIKISERITIPVTVGLNLWRPAEMTERSLSSIFKGGKDYYFGTSFYMSAGLNISL